MDQSNEQKSPIEFSGRADFALNTLSKADRQTVEAALFRLGQGSFGPDLPAVSRLDQPDGERYVLRASDRFRVLFTIGADKKIMVEDIINHDLVEYFRSAV